MIWIDAKDLQKWAGSKDSQSTLPYLIRRLVRATICNFDKISFPTGDSTSNPGYDGILITKKGNEFVPAGISVWEFGTDREIRSKANSDYKKRCEDPLGIDPSQTTFVFVTPRAFVKCEEWIKEKKADNIWKDVIAINSDQLEEWIEQAPSVGLWLALHLNQTHPDIESADDWWRAWIMATNPPIIPELLLSGRKLEEKKIINLMRKCGCFPIAGNTPEEVIAFIIASFLNSDVETSENFISRAIIVKSEESYRKLVYEKLRPLVIISLINSPGLHSIAEEKGHTVFLPIGFDDFDISDETIILPKGEHQSFIDGLKKMGYSWEEASQIEIDTKRNLSIFRRRILKIKKIPDWIKDSDVRELIPFILVGGWDSDKKYQDHEILASLNESTYDLVEITSSKWEKIQDSPIKHDGSIWRLQSHNDIWERIGRKLTAPDFNSLKKIAVTIFSSENPIFDLDLSQRWMAEVYGKIPPYSQYIRKGIATTLLWIAVSGDKYNIRVSVSAQSFVDSIVYQLLDKANGHRWCSLHDVLPILAEASPSGFLDSIERSLETPLSPIMEIFPEKDDQMHPSNTHTGLLWGLETLAWDPNYLARVALILLELSKRDPGGIYVNRPYNSLKNIFLLWYPHTSASLKSRTKVLDSLIIKDPKTGWNLLIDLIDKLDGYADPTTKPRWREYEKEIIHPINRQELWDSIQLIFERIIKNINSNGARWVQLLNIITKVPKNFRCSLYHELKNIRYNSIEDQLNVWDSLRSILASQRSHPTSKWVFDDDEITIIEELYLILTPKDPIHSIIWLFNSPSPDLPYGQFYTDDYDSSLEKERNNAISSLLTDKGKFGIVELIKIVGAPHSLAESLHNNPGIFEDYEIFEYLQSSDVNERIFALRTIQIKAYAEGREWIDRLINTSLSEKWNSSIIICFLSVMPENGELWDLLNKYPEDIQKKYWETCNGKFFKISSAERAIGISNLISVGRLNTAISIACYSDKDLPPLLVIDILEKRIENPSIIEIDKETLNSYCIVELFKWLDIFVDSEPNLINHMISLEFAYLQVLCESGSRRAPKYLYQEIADKPKIFAECIEIAYKPEVNIEDSIEKIPISDNERNRIYGVYHLLENFHFIPGTSSSGEINIEILHKWIKCAQHYCEEKNRKTIGDFYIGKILGSISYTEQSEWPPEEICTIIEDISTISMRDGFINKVINGRGVTSRNPTEGGIQERELFERFSNFSRNLSVTYPKTSGILKKIALFYLDDAKHQDEEAEIMDSEY